MIKKLEAVTTQTLIPLSLVLLLAGTSVKVYTMSVEWSVWRADVTKTLGRIESSLSGGWSRDNMRVWSRELELLNSDLTVPDLNKTAGDAQ